MTDTPLVTCIMPTKDRPDWVKQSIKLFEEQTYPNRQLLIFDDSHKSNEAACQTDFFERWERAQAVENATYSGVTYFHTGGERLERLLTLNPTSAPWTLGRKRNEMVRTAMGDIICHWDDDDYYAPNRIARQVEMMQMYNAPVCGTPYPLFHDLRTGKSYRYLCPDRPYLYCSSLMYTREFWAAHPFPDVQVASGTEFEWCTPDRLNGAAQFMDELVVGIAHGTNTSPKLWEPSYYTPCDMFLAFLGKHTAWYAAMARRLGGLPPVTAGDANDCPEAA